MSAATFLLFSAGVTGMLALIGYYGFTDVAQAFASGATGIAAIVMFHGLPLAADTLAWRRLLPRDHRGRLRDLVTIRWIGESVGNLFPAAQLGGDLVRARLAARCAIPGPDAGASVIADITVSALTLVVFGAAGAVLLYPGDSNGSAGLLLGIGLSALAIVAFYLLQRTGLFSGLAKYAGRFIRHDRWQTVLGGAAELDRAVAAVYERRADVVASGAWALAGWVLGTGEVWLALHFLGAPVGLVDALIIEAMIQALRGAAFAVPGALGVQEGGFVALGSALGIDGQTALALALTRRARELLLGVPGLLAWQLAEGRHWFRRRRENPAAGATAKEQGKDTRCRSTSAS